jgi:predicted lipoprotein with Yx(FWY)xxD motif
MLRSLRTPAAVALAATLVLAACSSQPGGPSAAPSAPVSAAPSGAPTHAPADSSAPAAVTLAVDDGHVVGRDGMTVYLFKNDDPIPGQSACYGQCAGNWPAVVGPAGADAAVTGEIGTITRTDGTVQATLDGHPLYYFAGDNAAGDTNGQGLNDVWYLVSPSGDEIENEAEASADPMSGASPTPCGGRYCY